MARMTNKQIEHALERLGVMARQKQGERPQRADAKTVNDLVVDLSSGNKKLTPAVLSKAYQYFYQQELSWSSDKRDFQKALLSAVYDKERIQADAEYQEQKARHQALSAKIMNEKQRIEDEIVLGDAQQALELLRTFANWTK